MPAIPDLFHPSAPLTMSSREIADLCEARHNDVVATIERQFASGVLRESRKTLRPFAPLGGGRPTEVYDLTKRDTLVVVSGYNDQVRAKIIDRWIELETAVLQTAPAPVSRITFSTARREFKALKAFAKDIGLDENQATIRASKGIERAYGVDLMAAIGQPLLEASHQEVLLTVTEVGMRLGGVKARDTNLLLTRHGFQVASRDPKGDLHYEPTDLGRPHSRMIDQDKAHSDGAPVLQLRWLTTIVEALRAATGKEPDAPDGSGSQH